MQEKRYLIVNADDFGMSAGINRGIVEAHQNGIVTSSSLMVHAAAADDASAWARENRTLDVGLHFDTGEWVKRNHEWEALYEIVSTDDSDAVAGELDCQLDLFESMVGRAPTHIDSHQHVHREEPVKHLILRAAAERGIPVRSFTPAIRFCGDFYGQTGDGYPLHEYISVEHLVGLLETLDQGATELGCHPGHVHDLVNPYRDEREIELAVLCDDRVRRALIDLDIELTSFSRLHTVTQAG